ncbi:MAG: universal stress protein [Pyrinomonadaceae bacterium]|nr:universal stress protein [Sphingobacteriaceae bacterium]
MKTFNQIHKILIAVEDSQYSEKATLYGIDLARKLGAEIALLHVNELPMATSYIADPLLNEPPVMMPEVIHAQEDASKKLLNKIADSVGDTLTVFTFHKLGNPKEEILNTADEWNADIIILGTHGRTGFDHFLSGSVAEKVVRKAKCPVLIIPNKDSEN